ncbi:YcfL family protein [Caviibacterium pharyngocola]|uniref:DUF1425 domain-containing protein n=1 Tax=Caviibacterium pharyngocola TaxID=28159 RepID=A0A2M8RY76_9PAST|nr:DUF1425 domain-containing protein [Caviibacterium pharyngocola]PJG83838.1 DUF1425 domain-containing protein [Caviibacterium pharyngocola]
MKKTVSLLFCTALLTACGSSAPNLVGTTKPILTIESNLAPLIEAEANSDSAWVKNTSDRPLSLDYGVFWYDKLGVTQFEPNAFSSLYLDRAQKIAVPLARPTAESVNYRLYLRLK